MTPLNATSREKAIARLRRFLALPAELPWLEFKENSATSGPEIAKYACALGNSARLHDEPAAYMVWGVSDSHEIVGTTFQWQTAKGKGNEDLLPWLQRVIDPAPQISFETVEIDGFRVVLMRVPAAISAPYAYDHQRFFRLGSYTKNLIQYPDHERELWRKLNQFQFETSNVAEELTKEEIIELLDPEAFFMNRPELPRISGNTLIDTLASAQAISHSSELGWCIPAWSALMYARSLKDFPRLNGLAPRVMHFAGSSRTNLQREWEFNEGYAASFGPIMTLFETVRPGGETLDATGRRVEIPPLPTVAFREVFANALMHQDLEQRGQYLTVEIFSDRVEVTNPGTPLVNPERFIDAASTTRNVRLGEALRLAHFVEQRGSGWDKIVESLEAAHFPPALIRANGNTTVTLSAYRTFALMTTEEKIQAVYQHACLGFLASRPVTNASIRKRFGLRDSQASQATRLINAALEKGRIRVHDADAGPRSRRYLPYWAV